MKSSSEEDVHFGGRDRRSRRSVSSSHAEAYRHDERTTSVCLRRTSSQCRVHSPTENANDTNKRATC